MRISLDWLSDFVEWDVTDPAVIADRLTLSVAEIEETEERGRFLKDCCVGRVTNLGKHPKADRLSTAVIETDRGAKKVVCGGTNLKEGMLVAFAHVGATVRHGEETMTLEKAKIRGEESEGMICAADELGLETRFPPAKEHGDRPIIDLTNAGLPVGADLRAALGMTDVVFHVSNTAITHRPDLFSVVGFARECVALGLGRWKKKPHVGLPEFPKAKLPFGITVESKTLVPRYHGCLLEIDAPGTTPEWMMKRLEAAGWRSINLPIDITNFVATETGMPLHSFDAGDLSGDVEIRAAKEGETLVTLDGVERKLNAGAPVLSDAKGVFDLLGIMGGLRSSTKDTTRRVFLHSAIVDPLAIRRAIIATGHRTDAATVYEKGIPPVTAGRGFARALQLFLELVPGAKIVSSADSWGDDGQPATVDVSLPRVRSLIGADVSAAEVTRILQALECEVAGKDDAMTVTSPLHRRDLKTDADVAEEVARIHGYEKVEEKMPTAEVRIPQREERLHAMRDALVRHDYLELTGLSLLGPTLLKKAGMGMTEKACARIASPLGEDTSLFQPSTFPRLLEHAQRFLRGFDRELRTFQQGDVSFDGRGWRELGLLVTAKTEPDLVHEPFLEAKSHLESALREAGYELTVSAAPDPAPPMAHPGRYAQLSVGGNDIGRLFEVHPTVRKAFDLPFRAAAAIVDCTALFALPPAVRRARPLSTFPAVSYDVTVKAPRSADVAGLLEKLRSSHALLEDVRVADLYAGKNAGDVYSLTLRFTYRAPDRTLTEEELSPVHAGCVTAIGLPVA